MSNTAIEMVVDPSFVEKEWYAVELLKCILGTESNFKPIFSGGTSLSKGFGLIQRFSEDLDFKVVPLMKRNQRSQYRESLLKQLDKIEFFEVQRESLEPGKESSFFKCDITYPQIYSLSSSLRPHLKLEMSFCEDSFWG